MLALFAQFPSWIDPYVIPGLPIRWYAVMYLVAFGIAYALFRYQCRHDRYLLMSSDDSQTFFFYAILATIMVPFESFVVPLYTFVRNLHGVNTYFGLVIPSIISSFGIFFMKQNMEQIPDALVEAAKIDGAGNWKILRTIIMPLSVSSLSVLSILLFLTAWSDYLWPLIIATSQKMFVLEIGLTLLQDEYFTDYGQMMAGCAVALVPALILFIFFRRHIMEGIAMSGIKG